MSDSRLASPTLRPASRVWDRLGAALSGLCAAHCLLLPLLLVALPLGHGAHAVHELWHPAMAVLLVPVTVRAARQGSARLLRFGLALVWLGVVAQAVVGEIAGVGVTLVGSGFLLAGHGGNLRCACPRPLSPTSRCSVGMMGSGEKQR